MFNATAHCHYVILTAGNADTLIVGINEDKVYLQKINKNSQKIVSLSPLQIV